MVSVYLYGSALWELQRYSDIDLFVVLSRPSTNQERASLVSSLLKVSGLYMKSTKRPIEMTLVQQSALTPWQYPPEFDFQYGEWLREDFSKGNLDPWPTKKMPDLAILITQILVSSVTLWGASPSHTLSNPPYEDFLKATKAGMLELLPCLIDDTRNVLLTLARIWKTLETHTLCSKTQAAEWAKPKLPPSLRRVLNRAYDICVGLEPEHWEDMKHLLKPCADFMAEHIHLGLHEAKRKAPPPLGLSPHFS